MSDVEPQLRAELAVQVYAIGVPGRVLIDTLNMGPVWLTPMEQVRTLRAAANKIERAEQESNTP